MRSGYASNTSMGTCQIRMFALITVIGEAKPVIDKLPELNVFTWSAIILQHAKLGKGEQAIALYNQIQQSNLKPDGHVFVAVLKACAMAVALTQGRLVHIHIMENGFRWHTIVGNSLINMYIKCGSLKDAGRVFDKLPNRSVVTWTAMIAGNAEHGHGWYALQLFWQMQGEGIEPDHVTFVSILKTCSIMAALVEGRMIHAKIVESKDDLDLIVANTLIDMYAKCGSFEDAHEVFDKLPTRSVVTWNVMIAGYAQQHGCSQEAFHLFQQMLQEGIQPTNLTWNALIAGHAKHGHGQKALELFQKMQHQGSGPDNVTFVSILKACSSIADLEQGRLIHTDIMGTGCELEVRVGNTLIDMYVKCGSLVDAHSVFYKLVERSVVTWTAMIAGYSQHGCCEEAFQLFQQMQQLGIEPNHVTFISILKSCSTRVALEQGKSIHSHIIICNFEMDVSVGNSLIDMYAKCGSLEDAQNVFETLPRQSVVTWTTMIAGYAQNADAKDAFILFQRMHQEGMQPNNVTWNALIAGSAEHGHSQEALQVFQQMQEEGLQPDNMTFVSVLKACCSSATLSQGMLIHACVIGSDFEFDVCVGNTLIDMYSKLGRLELARRVFDRLPNQDAVTWNAMISGYSHHEDGQEAFLLFQQMKQEGIVPNQATVVSILKTCSGLSGLGQGKLIHSWITESEFGSDVVVGNALIDMYIKCGSSEDAHRVFEKIKNPDVVTWTAMIAGCTQQSNFKLAVQYFKAMQHQGLKPDDVTFICLLSACSHIGLVEDGCQLFASMSEDHRITPKLDHYNCMINLLGSSGCWNEAKDLLQTMPFQLNIVGWTSLLCHCRSHGNVDLGEYCFEQVVSMDHRDAAGLLLMSNIYIDAGMCDNANQTEDWRKSLNAWKKPGKAFIEVDNEVYDFVVGDKSHPQTYAKLTSSHMQMKDEGYVPQLDLVLQPVSVENLILQVKV